MRHKLFASRQQGVTLVSLLVGLVVAMIAILAMLTLYRTAVHVTVQSEESAQIAGDRSAAMLTAHRVLQNIGFGVLDAQLEDQDVLKQCDSISLGSGNYQLSGCDKVNPDTEIDDVLIWRYETFSDPAVPPTGWCEGLAIDNGSLFYLRPQGCASLNVTSWAETEVARLFPSSARVSGGLHKLEFSADSCRPFGIQGATAAHSVSLVAHHPISDPPSEDPSESEDPIYIQFRMQTCLTNLSAI
ncbi:MAG: hypothetical protein M0Q95_14345 [Porticoccaceae bacterium]|nr:hypothetical protein [Porticoccaceae bacterium]